MGSHHIDSEFEARDRSFVLVSDDHESLHSERMWGNYPAAASTASAASFVPRVSRAASHTTTTYLIRLGQLAGSEHGGKGDVVHPDITRQVGRNVRIFRVRR